MKLLWTAQTKNRKTGNVPTAYVGESVEEAWASCQGCELRDNKRCYAWNGTVAAGFWNIIRGAKTNPIKYTFGRAMADRSVNARMVRVGALGDPSHANHKTLRSNASYVRKHNMAFVGYTHHHRKPSNADLKDILMASCETIEQADEAVSRGWRATTIVPWDFKDKRFVTPAGNQALVCPAQTTPNITCNDCRLCDASRNTPFKVIAFKDHGPQTRHLIRKAKKLPTV